MERLAISELTTYRWSFEEDVANYAAAGISAIGVWRQKLSDFGEEKGAELIREHGLAVSSLQWIGGFTGSDGRSYNESLQDAQEAIQVAGLLKAGCLVLYTGARGGHTHNHARRLIRGAITQLLPLAAEHNVTIAVKPMHPGCAAEFTFLTDLKECCDLVTSIGDEHLKLVFDVYQFGYDVSVLDKLPNLVANIALVQLADAKGEPVGEQDRRPIGEGTLPIREIVSKLEAAGYRGYYEIELLGESIENADYQELIRSSKERFNELFTLKPT